MTHELKIIDTFAYHKYFNRKPFEIRKNDRFYKVGDFIKYKVIHTDPSLQWCAQLLDNYFDETFYIITFITDYKQRKNYVVFTDEPTVENR